ncbi:NAD(P)-binding protein [Dothidotthia symphoricarpi CBS 119687]|uniref:NAD(P)-binding protein n=1 Tax=Dothidotthia symphoricarpi CBS 119687 TaxID=1392245 RepID=A0A6A6A757_9PLEO|nr:NAD(P)-binding protein [Dothidotthia symphoricarpi CBS 119687]KAF2126471.1 NAD(P)-binding protein [Dothidotthia symphoricarpi CBS 119687]
MTIGVALIGSGIFAKEEHLPAIQATSVLSLKAVYSRSLKSARTLSENLENVELYSDDQEGKTFEDLLKREDITGVIIALPILVQPDFIKKAIGARKYVLAEKPIAKDTQTAEELLQWIKKHGKPGQYAVAENFRFLPSFHHASQQISSLGRILSFRARVTNLVQPGGKYFETAWRKTPEYQGGFLLDGGVHFVAGLRLMLAGSGNKMKTISAFSAQLQEHLPPVDTFNSIIQIDSGSSGTLTISFGTTDGGSEYFVACEKGTVQVLRGKVVVKKDGKEETQDFPDEGSGVKQEVKAWAESLEQGKSNEMQSPEEALNDLRVLEACLRSGEQGGKPVEVQQ